MPKRTLLDIKRERDDSSRIKKERAEYRKSGVEVPLTHWTTTQMFDYYLDVKKKHGMKIIELKDQKSKLAALGAIKRLNLNGSQFVEFMGWAEREGKIKHIWHLIRDIDKFKKDMKGLFNGN